MPAPFVAPHGETSIVPQFAWLDGAILEIDPPAKTLRLMQILAMKSLTNLRARETSLGR
jgi:hypothetical protein